MTSSVGTNLEWIIPFQTVADELRALYLTQITTIFNLLCKYQEIQRCMLLQPHSWPIAVLSPEHTVIRGGQGPAEGSRRAQAADTSVRHWGTWEGRLGSWREHARPVRHAGICCQIQQAFCCFFCHVLCRRIFMLSFVDTLNRGYLCHCRALFISTLDTDLLWLWWNLFMAWHDILF